MLIGIPPFNTLLYLQAIDVWLVACLIFVFIALLEYAMANYLIVLQQVAMVSIHDNDNNTSALPSKKVSANIKK